MGVPGCAGLFGCWTGVPRCVDVPGCAGRTGCAMDPLRCVGAGLLVGCEVAAPRCVGAAVCVLAVGGRAGAARRVTGFSDEPVDGAGAGRASVLGAGLAFSVATAVRAGAGEDSAVVALLVGAVRRRVAGFGACSCVSGVALSVFARAVERLRVVVGFTCSLASGDSDVLLIKKTPFYQMICHGAGLKRLKSTLKHRT